MLEARIDLHAHTSFSEDRERIALPHGASITFPFYPLLTPADAFELALERGMTHVTFTDHDTYAGCRELLDRYPDDERFIPGEEVTCFHRGVPLHIGVYGLSEEDHRIIHDGARAAEPERWCLRWHVPELLAFLDDRGLAYDWKHPLWARDGAPPPREQFVDLFGRFDLIEAVNGTRHRSLNDLGARLARRLGGPRVAFTGGSDSHTTRIGEVYTRTFGATRGEVLANLRAGRCEPIGQHGSHQRLDDDIRQCVDHNTSRRAGQFIALADDYLRDVPQLAREVLALMLSGTIAFAVVHEFSRQRAMAREVAAMFADLADETEAEHAELLATPDPGGLVHGHLRRD